MPRYYPLKVLTRADQWCKVKDWLGTAGWVERGKLCSLRTAVVRRPRVNLRQGPGSRYKVAAKLYQGYIVKIVKYYRGWYKVMVLDPPEEKIGWLSARLIWG
jgi:SH3-like domain-containing protein